MTDGAADRSLTFGLAVFAVASAAAAFAGGVGQLVTARAVMGGAAAFIMPATLSILTNTFTDARERAMAIGIWSGVIGIGVVLGPLAGGFLLDHFWWGSVFIVNVPIAVARHRRRPPPGARVAGPARATASTGSAARLSVVGLVVAGDRDHRSAQPRLDERARGRRSSTVSAAALAAFAVWESRVEHPMLDVSFFRNRRFSAASATITLVFFALFGFVFLSTQYLQFVLGYTPFDAGLRTLPFAAAMIVVAPFSSKARANASAPNGSSSPAWWCSPPVSCWRRPSRRPTGYPRLGVAMLLLGAGLGLSSAPATESIMGSLPTAPGRCRLGRQRHRPGGRRRARRGHRRQHQCRRSTAATSAGEPPRRPARPARRRPPTTPSAPPSRSAAGWDPSEHMSPAPPARPSSTPCRERPSSRPASPQSAPSSRGVTSLPEVATFPTTRPSLRLSRSPRRRGTSSPARAPMAMAGSVRAP